MQPYDRCQENENRSGTSIDRLHFAKGATLVGTRVEDIARRKYLTKRAVERGREPNPKDTTRTCVHLGLKFGKIRE